jgi:hypothetical protein
MLGNLAQHMTEVFLCVADYSGLCPEPLTRYRYTLANACHAKWEMDGFTVHVITPKIVGCSNFDFQKVRRQYAEAHAKESIYVVADDDCLPLFHVEQCAEVMRGYPQFAILSLFPQNCNIQPWTPDPEVYDAYSGEDVMEHVSVGGIRFMRKGYMTEWPSLPESGAYDFVQCEYLRQRKQMRSGYFRNFQCLHLGEGQNVSTLKYGAIQKAQKEILANVRP